METVSDKNKRQNSKQILTVMVVEDNDTMRLGIRETLERDGYGVRIFADPEKAVAAFEKEPVPIIITDLKMQPLTGMDVLKYVKKREPKSEVLLISAYGTVQTAVDAMRLGAADFITKPFSPEELRIRLKRVEEQIQQNDRIERLEAEQQYYRDELMQGFGEIVGASAAMQEVFRLIKRVSGEDASVLIEGESGTGKELVARAIHRSGPRRDGPFIRVNCGALNDNLLESELFGHEKGAFTGAIRSKQGRFELADGGTLFLDEIGDISAAMQVKLLRALQEKEFERVGGEKTYQVDIRLVTATNHNLLQLISENRFREDLYYRLNVIPIKLPALRERPSDIPLLTEHFLERLNRNRARKKTISPEAMILLKDHSWPGNIRELENLLERLYVMTPDAEIGAKNVSGFLGQRPLPADHYNGMQLDQALESYEKNMIRHALREADGVKKRAARILGIKTSTLYYKMEKYGLLK